jgi:hypothetical protein
MELANGGFGRAGAPEDLRTRIGGLMQDAQYIVVLNRSPGEFSWMGTATDSSWKEQVLLAKLANRRTGGPGVLEAEKDLLDGSLYLQIGIKHHGIGFGVTQSNG